MRPLVELGRERVVVDERTAGGVHQRGTVDHRRQLLGADHSLCRRQRRCVKADDVARAQQLVELNTLHSELRCVIVAQEGIRDHDLRVEGTQQLDRQATHVGRADDADSLGPVADRVAPRYLRTLVPPQALALGEGVLVGPEDGCQRVLGDRHRVGRRA